MPQLLYQAKPSQAESRLRPRRGPPRRSAAPPETPLRLKHPPVVWYLGKMFPKKCRYSSQKLPKIPPFFFFWGGEDFFWRKILRKKITSKLKYPQEKFAGPWVWSRVEKPCHSLKPPSTCRARHLLFLYGIWARIVSKALFCCKRHLLISLSWFDVTSPV